MLQLDGSQASTRCSTLLRDMRSNGLISRTKPAWRVAQHSLLRPTKLGRSHKRHSIAAASATIEAASLVASGSWGHWALLAVCAAGGQVLERRTAVGQLLSAPLLAIMLGLALSSTGIVPTVSAAYDVIWAYFMPMAAALYLLESDVREVFSSAGATLAAFCIGTLGTIAGTFVAWAAFGHLLGSEGWKVASALCASYIGGSVNFAAVAQTVGMAPGPFLAATMAADNIAMAVYLAAITLIPAADVASQAPPLVPSGDPKNGERSRATSESLALSFAAAAAACAIGNAVAEAVGFGSGNLAVVAVVASAIGCLGPRLGTALRSPVLPFTGAEAVGGALMLLFFATIGAAAGSLGALASSPWLLPFVLLQLGVHMGVQLGLGRLAGLPMQALLTASNACVGGPGTAAAMAASRGWPAMVRPAMLTGSLGYAIGTGIGCAVGALLQTW